MEYQQLKELIPKNKNDFEPFPVLSTLSDEEIKPILPKLFEWIIDAHWPIARSVVDILIKFPDIVIPEIKNILNSNSDELNIDGLKHAVIYDLIPQLPVHLQKQHLLKDIMRILLCPTDDEVETGVWNCAKFFAERYYGKEVLKKLLAPPTTTTASSPK